MRKMKKRRKKQNNEDVIGKFHKKLAKRKLKKNEEVPTISKIYCINIFKIDIF
jgi:predicted kinase